MRIAPNRLTREAHDPGLGIARREEQVVHAGGADAHALREARLARIRAKAHVVQHKHLAGGGWRDDQAAGLRAAGYVASGGGRRAAVGALVVVALDRRANARQLIRVEEGDLNEAGAQSVRPREFELHRDGRVARVLGFLVRAQFRLGRPHADTAEFDHVGREGRVRVGVDVGGSEGEEGEEEW